MFEVITYPFFDDFLSLCADSKESIKLCSPFVKEEIVESIFEVSSKNLSIELITNINLESFHRKSSDLEAISKLVNNGTVYNHTTLHAKFFIFDNKKCLITSANLTASGLKRNFECGLFTDDSNVVDFLACQYKSITNDSNVGVITNSLIYHIEEILNNIPMNKRISYPPLDISLIFESDIYAVRKTLKGWKKSVFELIDILTDEAFSTKDVKFMAKQLEELYPKNHNREAKIRQVLQNLRDIGLIEFTSPGFYRRLWRRV